MTPLTADQRRAQIPAANAVRNEIATLRRDLRTGQVNVTDVFVNPPACACEMLVTDLLLMVPFLGKYRVEMIGRRAWWQGINLVVRVGHMPDRTRDWLLAEAPRLTDHLSRARSRRTLTGVSRKNLGP